MVGLNFMLIEHLLIIKLNLTIKILRLLNKGQDNQIELVFFCMILIFKEAFPSILPQVIRMYQSGPHEQTT